MAITAQERDKKILLQSSLFRGIGKEAPKEIFKMGSWKSLSKGSVLFRQGENAENAYILTQGKVKLTQITSEGVQVMLRILGPGQLIAGIAVLENVPYPATAQMMEKGLVFILKRNDLLKLMKEESQIGINVMKILLNRIQELQDRFRELATERVEKRVARAVLRLAHHHGKKNSQGILIDFPLTRQDLAELTGTTLFSISRLLKSWESSELLTSEKKRICLLKVDILKTIAEN